MCIDDKCPSRFRCYEYMRPVPEITTMSNYGRGKGARVCSYFVKLKKAQAVYYNNKQKKAGFH